MEIYCYANLFQKLECISLSSCERLKPWITILFISSTNYENYKPSIDIDDDIQYYICDATSHTELLTRKRTSYFALIFPFPAFTGPVIRKNRKYEVHCIHLA